MRNWRFWDWLAYTGVFVAAVILAADTGMRQSPEFQKYVGFMHSAWWGFAPLILLVGATAILIARSFGWVGSSRGRTRRNLTNPSADFPTPNWHEPLEPVVNKEFRNKPSSSTKRILSIAGSSTSHFSTTAQCRYSFQTALSQAPGANIFYRQITLS